MSFEQFVPRRIGISEPMVTISPGGRTFWINSSATREFFQDFRRTFLLYDRERKIIGFKPTKEQKHSYALSKATSRTAITVSGMAFSKYYKIPPSEKTKGYKATWNDREKLLEIDLNKPL